MPSTAEPLSSSVVGVSAAAVAWPESTAAAETRWDEALAAVVADPGTPVLHAQPIVELTQGQVAGYEMLSRFPTDVVRAAPDAWYAAADARGLSALLQARVVRRVVENLGTLPGNAFATVNLDPHLIGAEEVTGALAARPRLDRLVLELTENTRPRDLALLDAMVTDLRARGGMVAVDDAGTGYAGLTRMLRLRADMIKVDRELVSGIDVDPVKRAMVTMLGELAGQMDAWVLCEGVETAGELEVLLAMGVPLGQGYHLGRPAAHLDLTVAPEIAEQITRAGQARRRPDEVASLVRPATTGRTAGGRGSGEGDTAAAPAPGPGPEADDAADVLLDSTGRPVLVRDGGPAPRTGDVAWREATLVATTTSVREAALRAVSRPASERTVPLVCTDGRGAVVGTITLTDLVVALVGSTPDR